MLLLIYTIKKKKKTKKIHRLVAIAFLPNKENKKQVNHIDGNKQNNVVSNLEWITPKNNIAHVHSNGLYRKASRRLKKEDIIEIRKKAKSGVSRQEISKEYGISLRHVSNIKNDKVWKGII